MSELFGLPEWSAITVFVGVTLIGWLALSIILHQRGLRRLAAKRPSPSREQFVAMLAGDVDADVAEWLWDQALPYYAPLTHHPDDHFADDAMIDDGDWSMDWPRKFALQQGFSEKQFPKWPDDWSATLRNFARWLDTGRNASSQS